jgi:hypothetical protein
VASRSEATSIDLLVDALATFEHDGDSVAHELAAVLRFNLRSSEDMSLSIAEQLLACAGSDDARRAALADYIGHAARALAPNDEAPDGEASASAWSALVAAAHALNGSGAYALGRLRFVSDAFFRRLVDEAHRQLGSAPGEGASRAIGPAGDALAALAVSRQLRAAVSRALGCAVVPTYDALYEYDPPGSRVRTHVDSGGYEIVVHLLLEHTARDAPGRSVLIAHLPNEGPSARISLGVGDALALRGRGTVHAWQPLGDDERRILTAIGFRRATE